METIISTKGIKKGFPIANGETFWALKGINLEIARGQLTILKGRSGSGKTTLMNILSALDNPTEGHVFFQGTDIACLSEKERSLLRRTKIGFVFQSVALIPMMTAFENVEYALRMAKCPGDWKSRAEECLRMVDLGKRLHHLPQELSGGEQQRVAIARAIAHRPEVLFLDEPFSALDPTTKRQMYDMLCDVHERFGCTIIFVTHDFNEAQVLADRVGIILDGRLRTVVAATDLFATEHPEEVNRFLGIEMGNDLL